MNLNTIKITNIRRIIAHEIKAKTEKKDAYAVTHDDLLGFTTSEKEILITRLTEAITNTGKTFQLAYEEKGKDSFYALLDNYQSLSKNQFIEHSGELADKLAAAHFRTKIPGGYLLMGDGTTSKGKLFIFVIKAELQQVFSIKKNKLEVIKDVFLSPAKDFYKVGFFLESGAHFMPFMYDDQFSLQKRDLTEYFYSRFLGLTTDKNDRLKSKNFFDDTRLFIERNVDNISDRVGLMKALTVLYREDTSGIISPREFADTYFEGKLKSQFEEKVIEEKYPLSFTKDISLIDNRLELQRMSIPLSYTLSIVGNPSDLEDVSIIEDPDSNTLQRLQPEINSGKISKIVVLRQAGNG